MRSGIPSLARQETAPATWKPFMIWKMLVCAGGDGRSAVICSSPLFVLGSERGSIHRTFLIQHGLSVTKDGIKNGWWHAQKERADPSNCVPRPEKSGASKKRGTSLGMTALSVFYETAPCRAKCGLCRDSKSKLHGDDARLKAAATKANLLQDLGEKVLALS